MSKYVKQFRMNTEWILDQIEESIGETERIMAEDVVNYAKKYAPVGKTGRLKSSIGLRLTSNGRIRVGTNLRMGKQGYGYHVEQGVPSRGMSASHFILKAKRNVRRKIKRKYGSDVKLRFLRKTRSGRLV